MVSMNERSSFAGFAMVLGLVLLHAGAGVPPCRGVDFDLSIDDGWSLVSLPITPDDPSVEAVFGNDIAGPVWAWTGREYKPVTAVQAGVGYWVYGVSHGRHRGARTVTGQIAAGMPATLTPGWHLLGPVRSDAAATPLPVPLPTNPAAAVTDPVWQYGAYGYEVLDEVAPGDAAWVRVGECASVLLSGAPHFAGATLLYSEGPMSLTVHWPEAVDRTDDAASLVYFVYLAPSGTRPLVDDANRRAMLAGGSTSATINGLTPGVPYECVVVAQDPSGNRSRTGRSPLAGTPLSADFQLANAVHDLASLGIEVLAKDPQAGTITVDSAGGMGVGDTVVFTNPEGRDVQSITAIDADAGGDVLSVMPISLEDVVTDGVLEASFRVPAPATLAWQAGDSGGRVHSAGDALTVEQPAAFPGCGAGGTLPLSGVREIQPGVDLVYDVFFAPSTHSRIVWDAAGINSLFWELHGDLQSSLRLTVSSDTAVAVLDQALDLGEVSHQCRYTIGGLPVRQEITVQLKAVISVETPGGVSASLSVEEDESVDVEVTYEEGAWQSVADLADAPVVDQRLTAGGDVDARIAVYPVVTSSWYSVDGIVLERKPEIGWDMAHRSSPPPRETTKAGVTASTVETLTADPGIFGTSAGQPYEQQTQILASTDLFTLPDVQFVSPPSEGLVEAPVTVAVSVVDGVNNPVPDEGILWFLEDAPAAAPSLAVSVDRRSATFTPTVVGDYTIRCVVRGDGGLGPTGDRSAVVTVSAVNENYLIIDVSEGAEAQSYPVTRALTVPDPLPDTYKTSSLLLRRISADGQSFTMGSPAGELGRASDETQHQAAFSNDFYIGVLEVTQRQWELVMGEAVGQYPGDSRPVEEVSYDDIRGDVSGDGWPRTRAVDAASFLGVLRARTSLPLLDLPTEAQWEYACRAGTTTALNNGENLSDEQQAPELDALGRYGYNGSETSVCGTYLPNAWGLYDMHGNVAEWCLDWYANYSGDATDPTGPETGTNRVLRGGAWQSIAAECRSAARNFAPVDNRFKEYGFRLASLALDEPQITSFIPAEAEVGAEITVNGDNFTGAVSVLFNGVAATEFVVDADAQLRATVPENATTGPIAVTTVAGAVISADDFTVAASIPSPTFVQAAAGASVNSAGVTTSTAVTGAAGDLYLAAVSTKEYTPVTSVTGLGLTWTRVDAQCAGRSQTGVEVWMAQGAPSGDGVVQATLEDAPLTAVLTVARYSDVPADTPLGSVISANTNGLNGACTGGTDSDEYDLNIAVSSGDSLVVAAVGKRRRDLTPGTGYALRSDITADSGSVGDDSSVALLDRVAGPLTNVRVRGVLSSSSDWAVIAVEILPME